MYYWKPGEPGKPINVAVVGRHHSRQASRTLVLCVSIWESITSPVEIQTPREFLSTEEIRVFCSMKNAIHLSPHNVL